MKIFLIMLAKNNLESNIDYQWRLVWTTLMTVDKAEKTLSRLDTVIDLVQ